MSNGSDPDQERHFGTPDLDPNCLQMLSADNSKERVDNYGLSVDSDQLADLELQFPKQDL